MSNKRGKAGWKILNYISGSVGKLVQIGTKQSADKSSVKTFANNVHSLFGWL